MSYPVYKFIHYLGLTLLVFALTAAAYTSASQANKTSKLPMIVHGVALLLMLVSGFGMAARLGIFSDFPTWLSLKLALWLVLGAFIALVKRKAILGLFLSFVVLGGIYYLAVFKL
ncbi:MAG: hypothetical protein N2Z70_01150 [Bdellovibrionaceae bacterium]|jgi:hypothetical protein|nr:hypothetical protein [Pseudobdellovibrionaceae bacterium]